MLEENLSLTSQEKLKLASWGLPSSILKKYAEKGVVNMFPWQVECLCSPGVLSGGNLVYSAPTSAGKTLVAEILAIKTILERRKKVFFILPFVSVVREKMLYFKELFAGCGVHVHGFMGSHVPPGGFKTTNLAVCTIEKANGLINRLVEERELGEVGCVIVDELHLLGDPHRGYLLELLLAKIKFVTLREAGVKIQVIGMSATLPNLNLLAGWLDAALYCTNFRPVPLTEYLKVESSIYNASNLNCVSMKLPEFNIKDDPGDIIKLCIETLLYHHSVLIFCPTKNWCEALALQIASEIRKIGCSSSELGLQLRQQLNRETISDLLEQLKRCPVGLEAGIAKCVSFGVAYHHAGLTLDERDILENSFRQSILRVLVATSTLSSGVNLPARRVIVRSPLFGSQPMDILSYKQMIGRAGRMGKDTAGESFLICKASERKIGEKLVNAQLPPVESCLGLGDLSSSLKRAVLEVIASGVVTSLEDVKAYTSCTLFAASQSSDNNSDLTEPITACIEFLKKNQFIRLMKDNEIAPTNLGEACLSASLPPDQALRLLSELHKARQCFVLDSELHVIYQVTPFSVSEQWRQLDWMSALRLWENLSPSMQRVGELVGVEERFLIRAIRGNINTNSSVQMDKLSVFRRFYTALALQDLVNEMPLVSVAEKYKCSKGMLQSLQQSASTFAGMVTQFCRRLGWSSLELLVSQFSDRLQFGVQRELLDLLKIDCITAVQARSLFDSNIQSLSALATSRVEDVEKALRKAVPFESEKECNGKLTGKYVCLAGRSSLTEREAANLIISEARNFIQVELGLKSVNWMNNSNIIGESNSEIFSSVTSGKVYESSPTKIENYDNAGNVTTEDNIIKESKLDADNKSDQYYEILKSPPASLFESNVKSISEYKSNVNNVEETSLVIKACPAKLDGIEHCDKVNTNITCLKDVINKNDLVNEACSVVNYNDKKYDINSAVYNVDSIKFNDGEPSKTNFVEKIINEKPKHSRNSLDMFEDSENSSFSGDDDENDNKFQDVICSLSLYENKVSKILNDDDLFKNIQFTEEIMKDKKNEEVKNIEEVINGAIAKEQKEKAEYSQAEIPVYDCCQIKSITDLTSKNDLCLNNQENNLWDLNTQFENMLSSMCRKRSLSSNKDFVCDGEARNSDFEDDSEMLLSTPMLKPKSILDQSYGLGSRYISKFTEKSMKEREIFLNSPYSINYDNYAAIEVSPTLKRNTVKTLKAVEQDVTYVRSEVCKTTPLTKCNGIVNSNGKLSIEQNIPNSVNNIFQNFKISTPVDSPNANNNISKSSGIDLFENSPMYVESCKSQLNIALSLSSLDDMDVNWGGDSILQNSMLLSLEEEKKQKSAIVFSFNNKRKKSTYEKDFSDVKKIKLNEESDGFNKISQQNSSVKVIDANNDISRRVFLGKNLINNYKSVTKMSDKNSDIFVESPCAQRNNYFFESLNVDSQVCNVLDCASILNSNKISKTKHEASLNVFKADCGQHISVSKTALEDLHEIFINDNVSFERNTGLQNEGDRKEIGSFKIPSSNSNIQDAVSNSKNTKMFNGDQNFDSHLTKFKLPKPIDHAFNRSEQSIGEFKVSESILEAAAGFKSVVDFNEIATQFSSKETKNIDPDVSVKSCNKIIDKECSRSLQTRGHCNSVEDVKNPKTSRGESRDKLFPENFVNKCDFKDSDHNVCDSKKNVIAEKNEASNDCDDNDDSNNDLVISSQEDLSISTTRMHTRSMISQNFNESKHSNTSSIKNTSTICIENICSADKNKFELFKKNISKRKIISVSLDILKKGENVKEGIGARILARKNTQCEREGDFSFGSSVIRGIVIYWGIAKIFYLDFLRFDCPCVSVIKELFLRNDITIIMFDLKSKIKLLLQATQLIINCMGSDPVISDWILSPSDKRKTLRQMLKLNGIKCPLVNDDRISVREAVEIWYLNNYFQNKMKVASLFTAYKDIEMPVQFCLCIMEISGFGFDKDYVELLWDRVEIKMAELLENAYQISGRKFNPRSKAEFNKVQKFLANSVSENSQEIEKLSSIMQNWRKLNSLKTRSLSPFLLETKTRLFGDCITTTQTGRVSMHEPNLQNIPKDIVIDDEVFSMRTAFIPSPGCVLVSADYCQLELRILAHFSGDKNLLEAFNSSSDIFIRIAATWHKILESQVTQELRHHTKQICYGLIYGMGVASLSEQMQLSEVEAKEMMESFKTAYPTLQAYLTQCISNCRKTKEVRTLCNRVRFLPDIVSLNSTQRSEAERQAVNTTIQGSAADIAKLGMLKVESSLKKSCPSTRLILQLHDELIYEVPNTDLDSAVKIIKKELENAFQLKVPLPVKLKTGLSWGQLEVIDVEL